MAANSVGEYLDEMRFRHRMGRRILSMSQMALEVGLSINAVQQIISGKVKQPDPDTLRKLADRWGNNDDYRELMRLAGHPLPKPSLDEETILDALEPIFQTAGITPDQARSIYEEEKGRGMTRGLQRLAQRVSQFLKQRIATSPDDPKIRELLHMYDQLSPVEQRNIFLFAETLAAQREEQDDTAASPAAAGS